MPRNALLRHFRATPRGPLRLFQQDTIHPREHLITANQRQLRRIVVLKPTAGTHSERVAAAAVTTTEAAAAAVSLPTLSFECFLVTSFINYEDEP